MMIPFWPNLTGPEFADLMWLKAVKNPAALSVALDVNQGIRPRSDQTEFINSI
jgi:hypothetical protein